MIKHYFKAACKSFRQFKLFTFLNIIGLSLSFCIALLIFLFINQEYQVDKFQGATQGVYRFELKSSKTSYFLLESIRDKVPEIERIMRLDPFSKANSVLRDGDSKFKSRGMGVDTNFFTYMPFKLLVGNPETVLSDPASIVLPQNVAQKLLGRTDSIGQIILREDLASGSISQHKVSGIMEDFSPATSMYAEAIYPNFISYKSRRGHSPKYTTLFTLNNQADPRLVEDKIFAELLAYGIAKGAPDDFISRDQVKILPFTDIYFYGKGDSFRGGDIQMTRTYLFVAILLLLISSINYITLNTSIAHKKSKEIGIRKTIGADPGQLFKQGIIESLLIVNMALLIAYMLIWALLPGLNHWLPELNQLSIHQNNIWILLMGIPMASSIGFLAGIYPAMILSRVNPILALRGVNTYSVAGLWRKKALIVLQFAISVLLIFFVISVIAQIQFIKARPLGYRMDNIVSFPNYIHFRKNLSALVHDIESHPSVESMGFGQAIPGKFRMKTYGEIEEKSVKFRFSPAGEKYLDLFSIPLKEGRNFSKEDYRKKEAVAIINETGSKFFKDKSPIGEKVGKYRIIGVMEDFCSRKAYKNMEPNLLTADNHGSHLYQVIVKFKAGQKGYGMAFLNDIWYKYASDIPVKIDSMDSSFDKSFGKQKFLLRILSSLALVALLISCLGLFALSAFISERRKKEIGIRKVNGASIMQIFRLMTWSYIQLILWANVIALPIAYYLIGFWLNEYPYHIMIGWEIPLLSALFSILIAFLTVVFQSVYAAKQNPIKIINRE